MMTLSKYIKLIKKEKQRFPKTSVWGMMKYYRSWAQSMKQGDKEMSELPWMAFGAIEFLKANARPDMRVFEYGSGSSTLFWSKRIKEIVSVEHDKEWSEKMQKELKERNVANVEFFFVQPQKRPDIKPDVADPFQYATDDEQWRSYSFETYVKKINDYPDKYFDFVVVDGRARPSCIVASLSKVKTGGYLVVDNSERDYYFSKTLQHMPGETWQRKDFFGPVPGLHHFHQTSFFKKVK